MMTAYVYHAEITSLPALSRLKQGMAWCQERAGFRPREVSLSMVDAAELVLLWSDMPSDLRVRASGLASPGVMIFYPEPSDFGNEIMP